MGLKHQPPPKKEIAYTRSAGQPVTALADLMEAVSEFAVPTADTPLLVQAAVRGLQGIYKPGFKYVKAGVMLLDLQNGAVEQLELSLDTELSSQRFQRPPSPGRKPLTDCSLASPC